MKYYTFKKDALAHKFFGQVLRFTKGKGYWLFGKRPTPVTMYDSVSLTQIPANAQAVAGYVNGIWPTYRDLPDAFPRAHLLSIAVNATADADCLDVESGDATPDQAAAWVKRQLARGVRKPVLYTSVSNVPALLRDLNRGGITRNQIRLWTAHYTFKPHLCDKSCGFGMVGVADATQYSNQALGRNLDVSLLQPWFFV